MLTSSSRRRTDVAGPVHFHLRHHEGGGGGWIARWLVVSLLRGLCVPLGSLLQLFFSCNQRCNGQPTHFWFFGRLEIENGTLVISRRYADLNLHLWNGLVIKAHVRTCSGAALEPIGKSSQPIPHTCAPDPSMTG